MHITNVPRQVIESPETPQKSQGRPKMAQTQATTNNIETPTNTVNNTQEHTIIELTQESFARFDTVMSKQAEQLRMLMNLLT
jgi:hypothetical protein